MRHLLFLKTWHWFWCPSKKVTAHRNHAHYGCTPGAGGVGKSTSLKHISLAWANGVSKDLKQFDFVFHVALKLVKQNQNLEDIIIGQHKALKRHKVLPNEINLIVDGKLQTQSVLILLDGYDEYKKGTNKHIENGLIKESLPYSSVLLTSRDTKEVAELRPYMDVEAEITGFDPERVEEYITKYLASDKKKNELIALATKSNLRQTTNKGIDYGIMQVPIFLHMICVLFERKVSIPRTRTGIISAIVERCPDWEEIRKSEMKTDGEWHTALKTYLIQLGELSWTCLKNLKKDLTFLKVRFLPLPDISLFLCLV